MNNLLNIKTPAEGQAGGRKSEFGLENHGLTNLRQAYWNLPLEALYEEAIFRNEGKLTLSGPLVVNTGKHTARAATDKFIVKEAGSEDHIWWGQYNYPYAADKFNDLFNRVQGFLQGRDLFIQDTYAGADPAACLSIITGWLAQRVAHNMFFPSANGTAVVPEFPSSQYPRSFPAGGQHLPNSHRDQLRSAAVYHRQYRVRRRDQEIHFYNHELPPAIERRDDDALFGKYRQAI
jgi:hypothetical protein